MLRTLTSSHLFDWPFLSDHSYLSLVAMFIRIFLDLIGLVIGPFSVPTRI